MKQVLAAAGFVLALFAFGCAQQPPQFVPVPDQPLTPEQNRAKIHTELAAGYYSRGQLGVALDELRQALEADSNYGPAYNVLGLVYMDLREYSLAEQNFQHALRINPYDSDAQNNYGTFLCQRGRTKESIKHFLAALKNPLYATPEKSYVNAGLCARKAGDDKSAEDFFQKALKIQPAQPQALLALAQLRFKEGQLAQAKRYLTRFMQVGQPDAESLWLGVRVAHLLGDRDEEASYALQLKKRFPDSNEAKALEARRYE